MVSISSPSLTPSGAMRRRIGSHDCFHGSLADDIYEAPLIDQTSTICTGSDYSDHSSNQSLSPRHSSASYTRKVASEDEIASLPLHWSRSGNPANPQGDDSHHQPPPVPLSRAQKLLQLQNTELPLNNSSSSLVFTARKRRSTFSFAVIGFCLLGFIMYSNARSSLRIAVQEVNDLVEFSEKLSRQLGKADRDMRRLERELAAIDAMEQQREDDEVEERILRQSSVFADPDLIREMNNIQRKLKYSQTKADKLKTQVSEISKRDAIAKYGSGVIRVQLDLIFRLDKDGKPLLDTGPHTLVMEMAPIDLMPHSVYTFLEMVSSGLLDGCSFILNALHVLKAAPLPYDGTSASDKARSFLEQGLESVAFREYSPDFPHSKYTVGFAADGSPSFYINTEDNADIHVGDPCFAKIVSGFEAVHRLEKMPTRNGIWFETRIGIRSAVIL
ncbi:cyclophilin type peptidyl-prolyl cis-trans isomerase [Nitzschia inconspicua]|uniref:Cyclophilin type peptidyl-prolyl cis-trans isomerase n=1 Tax=Nitzschia inconspicua TaxID=303405 RepID=A0A9K3KWG8_9STRA|nr:cyclophilin type peptidyl-prolyl cis-trans isomerase [Nitzschia inconspicua]